MTRNHRIGRIGVALILVAAACAASVQPGAARKWPTYHIHHVYLTPTKVATARTSGYSTAPAGKRYLIVTFHVVNHDDVQSEVQFNDIKAATSDGKIVEQSFASLTDGLTSLVLDPGGSGDGALAWEIPANGHSALLRWSPEPLFSDARYPTYTWTLKI